MLNRSASALKRRDKVLRRIINQVGPCTIKPRRRYFVSLCDAIVSQQLSTKAANTISKRFRKLFHRATPTPKGVLATSIGQLRGVGLSGQKSKYVHDLATKFSDGTIPTKKLAALSDEEVIEILTQVKGIGVWTVHMFLIFVLNRPDVWPIDDLGVRKAVQLQFNLNELPHANKLHELAEPWRPHRTVAAWYLWRSLDNAPLDE